MTFSTHRNLFPAFFRVVAMLSSAPNVAFAGDVSSEAPAPRDSPAMPSEQIARLNGTAPDPAIAQLRKNAAAEMSAYGIVVEDITPKVVEETVVTKVLTKVAKDSVDRAGPDLDAYIAAHDVHSFTSTGQLNEDANRQEATVQSHIQQMLHNR